MKIKSILSVILIGLILLFLISCVGYIFDRPICNVTQYDYNSSITIYCNNFETFMEYFWLFPIGLMYIILGIMLVFCLLLPFLLAYLIYDLLIEKFKRKNAK